LVQTWSARYVDSCPPPSLMLPRAHAGYGIASALILAERMGAEAANLGGLENCEVVTGAAIAPRLRWRKRGISRISRRFGAVP